VSWGLFWGDRTLDELPVAPIHVYQVPPVLETVCWWTSQPLSWLFTVTRQLKYRNFCLVLNCTNFVETADGLQQCITSLVFHALKYLRSPFADYSWDVSRNALHWAKCTADTETAGLVLVFQVFQLRRNSWRTPNVGRSSTRRSGCERFILPSTPATSTCFTSGRVKPGLTPRIPRTVYRYSWACPFLLFSSSFPHFFAVGSVNIPYRIVSCWEPRLQVPTTKTSTAVLDWCPRSSINHFPQVLHTSDALSRILHLHTWKRWTTVPKLAFLSVYVHEIRIRTDQFPPLFRLKQKWLQLYSRTVFIFDQLRHSEFTNNASHVSSR